MMRRPLPIGRAGFSLLEVLVAVGLFSIFTLTLTRLMMGGMQTFQRGQAISVLRSDLRSALDLISADFRQSTGNSFNYASWTNNQALTLKFQRAVFDGSDNPASLNIIFIFYNIDPLTNRLTRREESPSRTVLVAENILVGPRPGESAEVGHYRSYFQATANPVYGPEQERSNFTLETRLTGMRYSGRQEQRLSMVTWTSQRVTPTLDITAPRLSAIAEPLAPVTDLGRPSPPRACLGAPEGGW
ncbi:MAG: prepilin-type N-terminal cleavage/methylation domain-containing protein [Burkholderiales bacterium]|nr:prepilin-type N-terminal cleavage/methylation domain-containing protein [Burkholderiales bacterium]